MLVWKNASLRVLVVLSLRPRSCVPQWPSHSLPGLERRVRLIDDLKRLAVAEDCKSMVAAVSGVALQLVDHVLTHTSFRFVAYGCLFDFRNTVSST